MKSRSYPLIAGHIFNTPLMVLPSMAETAVAWAKKQLNMNIVMAMPSARMMEDDGDEALDLDPPTPDPVYGGGVAVIPVYGVLVSRIGQLDMCETMTAYESLRSQIQCALDDAGISHIILDIDSCGGSVAGCMELADFIYGCRGIKPITALVNFKAFSAAYLIASACDEIVMSETSGAGSIGVIMQHADLSKANEMEGISYTTIFIGNHKNDGDPNQPLTDQARAVMEQRCKVAYDQFTGRVAKYRNLDVKAVIATQAGLYFGQEAIDSGLADRIEAPQDAVNRIASDLATQRPSKPSQKIMRMQARAAAQAMQAQL